jgi:hypothetical protein
MENDNPLNDDFLRELIGKSSLESPSGDFVEKVMNRIQPQPAVAPETRSFFFFLKSYIGYLLLAAILAGFFLTSDIPFLNWFPGKQYFVNTFLPYFNSILTGLKSLSGSGKVLSIPIMIIVASGLFFLLDKLLASLTSIRHNPSV